MRLSRGKQCDTPLAGGWRTALDERTGANYYFNEKTRQSTWEKPRPATTSFQIQKKGALKKRARKSGRNWKERHFILGLVVGESEVFAGELRYYKKLFGVRALSGCVVVCGLTQLHLWCLLMLVACGGRIAVTLNWSAVLDSRARMEGKCPTGVRPSK